MSFPSFTNGGFEDVPRASTDRVTDRGSLVRSIGTEPPLRIGGLAHAPEKGHSLSLPLREAPEGREARQHTRGADFFWCLYRPPDH
jgi:hypothetical protein